GQFLESLECRAALADERVEPLTDDLDDWATGLDNLIDIAVVVEDVEKALHVVGGHLALGEQFAVAAGRLDLRTCIGVGCRGRADVGHDVISVVLTASGTPGLRRRSTSLRPGRLAWRRPRVTAVQERPSRPRSSGT